jgi:hypothetical protein
MNADNTAASGAVPARPLGLDKGLEPVSLDAVQVLDHAHAVLSRVAFVELPQALTGELDSKQNPPSVPTSSSHSLIRHTTQCAGFAASSRLLQPGHGFLSLRCPIHSAQFIPHGAIISGMIDSGRTFSPEAMLHALPSFISDTSNRMK